MNKEKNHFTDNDKIFFLSRDANWQLYRNQVFAYLAEAKDLSVEILTTGELKEYLKETGRLKYKIFNNFFSRKAKPSFFPTAIWYIVKNRPKCVIALNNATQLTEYFAIIICRVFKIKFVWWTHAYDHQPIKSRFKRRLKDFYIRTFLHLAPVIITFSHRGKEYLLEEGFKDEKVFVAPNTLDTVKLLDLKRKFSNNFDRIEFLKSKGICINEQSRVLLFSGRINKLKKVDNALHAMAKILERKPNVYLIVVGDGEELNFLKSLSNKLGVEKNVYFAGSVFNDEYISKFFLSSDLFVMPGYVGLAIIHAFAFGLPIVTEKIGYHSPEIEFLKEGENGYLVTEDDVEEMANKILDILSDEELFHYLQQNALKTVLNEASIVGMIDQMYKAIVS